MQLTSPQILTKLLQHFGVTEPLKAIRSTLDALFTFKKYFNYGSEVKGIPKHTILSSFTHPLVSQNWYDLHFLL